MVPRRILNTVTERLQRYPAVALVGARQAGKTTLARTLSETYFDLEQPEERLRLDLQWDEVFGGSELIVMDEAQAWPEVFPRLRGAIDKDRKRTGRVLLLGSVSPSLMRQVSESLAGRLALVELTTFLLTELSELSISARTLWLYGGYPEGGVLDPQQFPSWEADYLTLLAQRDLPNWGLPAKPQVTDRLLKMLAAVHGQVWNASQIGQSLGLSHNTVNSHVDYLEGAFLVRRLPSFRANLRKRLVKSPKVYWRDTGLLHALLRVFDEEHLLVQPWVGASWEGFVIEQILGLLAAINSPVDPFFFRTSDRYEIDLVLAGRRELWAIEVKLTSQPRSEDFARLSKAADMIQADRRVLISQTSSTVSGDNALSCSLPAFLKLLAAGEVP
jgi:predicted AAA+ superfamily ATPase